MVHAPSFNSYKKRIELIGALIKPSLPKPIINSIAEIPKDEYFSLVCIIWKEQSRRHNKLAPYKPHPEDNIFIEDNTGKIKISNNETNRKINSSYYISGVVVGVYGKIENDLFKLSRIFQPQPPHIEQVLSEKHIKIAFVSRLELNSKKFDLQNGKRFLKAINDIDVLVIIGSSYRHADYYPNEEMLDWEIQRKLVDLMPHQYLEQFLKNVNCKILLVPGEDDPVDAIWPIQPIDRYLMSGIPNVILTTNPTMFSINNTCIACSSCEPVNDIVLETDWKFHEAQRKLVQWRHFGPSFPYTRACYTYETNDLMFMKNVPNYFICSGAENLEISDLYDVKIISITDFIDSNKAYILDLMDGEITPINCEFQD